MTAGKRLRLVVFDCDGVLFDSREANRRYYDDLLRHFGHPPMDGEELEYVHSRNAELATRHIFRKWPGELEAAERRRRSVDYGPYLRHMKMESGLLEFIGKVRAAGMRTAISTNRTTTMPAVMELYGLTPLFDMVVTALDVSRPKPHPEALERILGRFGLQAREGVYIGDSEVDLQHCSAVGMEMIAFRNPSLEAAYHASSFAEVARLPLFERRR